MPADEYKQKFSLPRKMDARISEFMLNKVLVGDLTRYGLQKPDHGLMQSHPIMNDQLIHHLGHGDIEAKTDIEKIEGKQVHFKDGSSVEVDLIIAATGYKRCFPFLSDQYLDLGTEDREFNFYLEIFSRKFNNLFFVGGIEVSSAVFGFFNLQGTLIAKYLSAPTSNRKKRFESLIQSDRTDPKKGLGMIKSDRHRRYVEKNTYREQLKRAIKQLS